jgi:flagellar biosynthetic protein FliR
MAQLLAKLAGGELVGFILVLARVGPLFLLAPLFSAKALPPRVRTITAVGISIGLTPVALHGQRIPGGAVAIGELIAEGLLCGLGYAFALSILFAALESASAFVDFVSGLSFGNLINPAFGNDGAAFTELYTLVGLLVFVVIGGDAWVLRGLAHTFDLVPLTAGPRIVSLVGGTEAAFASVFTSAVEIVAPILLTLAVTDVAFGVLSRIVPQLNVFAIGFPMKVAAAVLLVGATLPFVGGWISEQVSLSVASALHTLHAA